jgi:hypothetical protein
MKKVFLFLGILPLSVSAQINMPRPSPLGIVTQAVGLTDITITYSRPSAKGRVIFGELVPWGEMWRTGANASTKIKFTDDVKMEGFDVPAGEYALYTIPNKDEWTIIIHKNTTLSGTGGDKYDTAQDLCRFKVKANNTYPIMIETFTIGVADIKSDEAYIELLWANTQVRFKVKSELDKRVMAEITQKMKGVTASTYYQSAQYYYDNDKDLTLALEWINKALVDNEKYWTVRLKSLILAKMGRYEEAIVAAEKSKQLATDAKSNDYIKLNEKSIAEWTPKVPPPAPTKKGKK